MQANKNIYLVDDDAAVCHALSVLLEGSGYRVRAYHSANDYLEREEGATEGVMLGARVFHRLSAPPPGPGVDAGNALNGGFMLETGPLGSTYINNDLRTGNDPKATFNVSRCMS